MSACNKVLLGNLSADALAVFKAAYANSVKHKGGRVSTERLLAALPPAEKAIMAEVCAAAAYKCDFAVPSDADLKSAGDDWQSIVLFSTCVENTLKKCGAEAGAVGLVKFLKLLCATAVRLSASIAAHNVNVDAFFEPKY